MSTIRSSREIDHMFRSARRFRDPLVVILVNPTPHGRDPEGRVAVVAGKRLGNAVTRNRAKRVLRAAARQAGAPWSGRDVVLIAREPTADAGSHAVAAAVAAALRRAGAPLQ